MSGKAEYEIPAGLKQAQERFAEWRSSHTGRRPIPESLWAPASELAGRMECFARLRCFGWTTPSSSGTLRQWRRPENSHRRQQQRHSWN
jgi:hypothetical protein